MANHRSSNQLGMHRFFISLTSIDDRGSVRIGGRLAHQIHHVLPLKPGDHITVLDDSGWEYEVELRFVAKDAVAGEVREAAEQSRRGRIPLLRRSMPFE